MKTYWSPNYILVKISTRFRYLMIWINSLGLTWMIWWSIAPSCIHKAYTWCFCFTFILQLSLLWHSTLCVRWRIMIPRTTSSTFGISTRRSNSIDWIIVSSVFSWWASLSIFFSLKVSISLIGLIPLLFQKALG